MIKVQGLRKRDSYDEIVNNINIYPQTKGVAGALPNRTPAGIMLGTFVVNTHQYGSLLELDGLDEQDEAINKASVIQSIGQKIRSTFSNHGN